MFKDGFTGDTLIAIRQDDKLVMVPMKDIMQKDDFIEIYHINRDGGLDCCKGSVFPRGDDNVVRVTLDNGFSFKCVPDQKILLYHTETYMPAEFTLDERLQSWNKSGEVTIPTVVSIEELPDEEPIYDVTVMCEFHCHLIGDSEGNCVAVHD